MKTLVVGNSLDVLPIVQNILSLHKDEQVTLFTTEGVLPYDRSLLPALVAAQVHEQQIYTASQNFLAEYHPQVVTTEKLANSKRPLDTSAF